MPSLEEVKATVDAWFIDRIAKGPIAHHTPAYNQAYHARTDLKSRLAVLFGEPEPAAEPEPDLALDPPITAPVVPEPEPAASAAPDQE